MRGLHADDRIDATNCGGTCAECATSDSSAGVKVATTGFIGTGCRDFKEKLLAFGATPDSLSVFRRFYR